MTDQLTRIERIATLLLESAERIESACEDLRQQMPEQLDELKVGLDHISEVLRDKTDDKRNFGIGGDEGKRDNFSSVI